MAKNNKFGLATVKKDLTKNSGDFLKNIQKELVEEEHTALKDFIKGGYRLLMEKEKELSQIQKEIDKLRSAIKDASRGDWEKFQTVKIPARFFDEDTLRKHGKSLIEGSEEVRFVDLYTNEEEKKE